MKALSVLAVLVATRMFCAEGLAQTKDGDSDFHVWATSCAHVPADIRRGRESMALAIRQSEGQLDNAPAFDWDIMIDAGDLSAHQTPPGDPDGMELLRQYRALTRHRREQIYNVPGNHDAPYYDHGPGSWFRKWGDPMGENTEFSGVDSERRPFPVEGNWERYRFQAGNVLFLMLADRNDAPTPVGRGHSSEKHTGGYPPGAVTRETFDWWKQQVLENQDKIIVTMHHHMLRDTTTASGKGEGHPRYHGNSGGGEGSSYLYFLIENDDPENFEFTADAHVFEDFLDEFHRQNGRGAIDFWIGGHTHVKGPDDDHGDKTVSERVWGVNFLQSAALTRYHAGGHPLSRVVSFHDGRAEATVRTYLHEASEDEDLAVGFHEPATRQFPLRHRFAAPPAIESMPPFPESARVFDLPYEESAKGSRYGDAGLVPAAPSVELIERWEDASGGRLFLEEQVEADTMNEIGNKPELIEDSGRKALRFDGKQRLRIGALDVDDWTELSISAWIKTSGDGSGMRLVSKDRLGEPGCFMFRQIGGGAWSFRVWDDRAESWSVAKWESGLASDGEWHQLIGTVDSEADKIRLFVDGELRAEAAWTAATLDDSDEEELVVGADSGQKRFGAGFVGLISDVRLLPSAISVEEARAWFENP